MRQLYIKADNGVIRFIAQGNSKGFDSASQTTSPFPWLHTNKQQKGQKTGGVSCPASYAPNPKPPLHLFILPSLH